MGIWSMALFILIGIIFYVGWRGRQAFAEFIPPGRGKFYWMGYLLVAFSFIILERLESVSGPLLKKALVWVGPYSVAFLFYAFWVLLLIDILRLLDRWLGFIPASIKRAPAKVGLAVVCLLCGVLLYGSWNAWHPVVQAYQITIPKEASGKKQLHAVMLSDLHLGKIVNRGRLEQIVDRVKQMNPDIVLLAGDVIDGDPAPFLEQDMGAVLREMKPRLGVYMVLGNHDGYGRDPVPCLEAAGITVLRDQYQMIDNSFYIVGRDYWGRGGHGAAQPNLAQVMTGVDKRMPIILLKHSPVNLEEAQANGVDLQLSGHTHQGQLFPLHLVTGRMYEIDWGYLRKENLQLIVSTGVGTWGPPIRIGNTPEIVDLSISFQ